MRAAANRLSRATRRVAVADAVSSSTDVVTAGSLPAANPPQQSRRPVPGDRSARRDRQIHWRRATVSRVRASLDPAVLLHAIDLPNQGHRRDLEQVGKAGLVDALVAGEVAQ